MARVNKWHVMAGEQHGRGTGTACYVSIGLNTAIVHNRNLPYRSLVLLLVFFIA